MPWAPTPFFMNGWGPPAPTPGSGGRIVQNNPRLRLSTLASRVSPVGLPAGDLFVATDEPMFSFSFPNDPIFDWHDLVQGGQSQLGAPFPPGTAIIGPNADLSLRTTSAIFVTRRLDIGPVVPPFGELVIIALTAGAPGMATFTVGSITPAGALVLTDIGHFNWSVVG